MGGFFKKFSCAEDMSVMANDLTTPHILPAVPTGSLILPKKIKALKALKAFAFEPLASVKNNNNNNNPYISAIRSYLIQNKGISFICK